MTAIPSIPADDAAPDMPWQERLDRATFSVGFLTGAADQAAKTDDDRADLSKHCQDLCDFIAHASRLYEESDDDSKLRDRLSDLLTRTANALKGTPAPLSRHSWHDLPEVAAAAVEDLSEIGAKSSSLSLWWAMVEAEQELAGKTLKDNDVVLHFMGSGASHIVTVKAMRDMMLAIYGPAPEAKADEEVNAP